MKSVISMDRLSFNPVLLSKNNNTCVKKAKSVKNSIMEEEMDQDRAAIREEISKMSIEEVLALKEKIGTKLFDKSMGLERKKSYKEKYKRENKNRPRMEPISKKPVKRLKDVVGTKSEMKRDVRDPRFDPMCGDYDEKVI